MQVDRQKRGRREKVGKRALTLSAVELALIRRATG